QSRLLFLVFLNTPQSVSFLVLPRPSLVNQEWATFPSQWEVCTTAAKCWYTLAEYGHFDSLTFQFLPPTLVTIALVKT
ncbi:hypothetical protein NQZ68_025139, partial [Dissostichus eleginoides]